MVAGVHLRWSIGDDLGFPPGGFDIYRRERRPEIEWACLDLLVGVTMGTPLRTHYGWVLTASVGMSYDTGSCPSGLGLYLEGKQTLEVIPPKTARAIRFVVLTKDSSGRVTVSLMNG